MRLAVEIGNKKRKKVMGKKKNLQAGAKLEGQDDSGQNGGTTAEQGGFEEQFRTYAKAQPEILKLRKILLAIGGEQLVAPASVTRDVPLLVESGFLMDYPVTERFMQPHMCHLNSARLFANGKATAICTGFGLFGGPWVQHSWVLQRQKDGTNRILETTCKYDRYFGILYWGMLGKFVVKKELDFYGVKPPAKLEIALTGFGVKG